MIVVQARDIKVSFSGNEILKNINLAINEREKIGLVGVNGSGKTTLLRCLTGQLLPDQGEVSFDKSCSPAFLEQLPEAEGDATAWDTVMTSYAELIDMRNQLRELEDRISLSQSGEDMHRLMEQYALLQEAYDRADGYACENMARRILKGLGFSTDQFYQPLNRFSGGQKTRINLGRLLALAPNLLLLDEPTNHLDTTSVEWLEDYLESYRGTVLVVSHDRMFLNRVAGRILELRDGRLYSYPGDYANYLKQKASDDLAWQRAYEKQQEHIHKTEAYITRYKAGIKSRQARGRQAQLERLERIDQPHKEKNITNWKMDLGQESGQLVLDMKGLSKAYGELSLFDSVNLQIKKGDKLALIGPNGSGKTTLLKMITGLLTADQGEVRTGSRVKTAYFSQEYEDLNLNNTLLDEIVYNFDIKLEEARNMLGRMLFKGDDVYKKTGDLSGGERGRLSLLKLLLTGANFLILDEPSNHLDIESCQAVEEMLSTFPGTILLVSHDRYLINQIADGILAIENKKLEYYWGNYNYYYEKRLEKQGHNREVTNRTDLEPKRQKQQRLERKEKQSLQKRRNQQLSRLEHHISDLEIRKKELEEILSKPESYDEPVQAKKYSAEYNEIEQSLEAALGEWEALCMEIEELN